MKKCLYVAIGIVSLLLIAVMGLFLFRGTLLRWTADREISKIESRYGLRIHYDRLLMPSIHEIELQHLSVVPRTSDTLLTLNRLQVNLKLVSLWRIKIAVTGLSTDGLTLRFIRHQGQSNYDFLFQQREPPIQQAESTDYANRVAKATDLLFRLLPENGKLKRLTCVWQTDLSRTVFSFDELQLIGGRFACPMRLEDNGSVQTWYISGNVDKQQHRLEGKIRPEGSHTLTLPPLMRMLHAGLALGEARFALQVMADAPNLRLSGEAAIEHLEVYQPRISPDTVTLNRASIQYHLSVGRRQLRLDSTTVVMVNEFCFHPQITLIRGDKWHVIARVREKNLLAQSLFNSLPPALFRRASEIRADGRLHYDFLLDIDFNRLDSLRFHSILSPVSFRISDLGNSGLTKLNGDFEYTAYEDDRPVRTFVVGPSNPNFLSLAQMGAILPVAVMQSEDGSFFYHDGFYPGAIQEALIYDLKVGRFARGGSSITMQIVKNVFLNKHKTLARKLEEALLVWLIENQHLTSKERLLEVYLNIIEWAPGIYGASEASQFYFNKQPWQLTVEEAIFLASLIPRPKHFRSLFNADASLKANQEGYFRLLARRLAVRGVISEAEADSIRPSVNIVGPARLEILRTDTLSAVTNSLLLLPSRMP